MCQFCESKSVEPIDMMMANKNSFNFFSTVAIQEAIRQTSGTPMCCIPVCAEHRAMIANGSLPAPTEESEEVENDSQGVDGDCEDEYDGT